MKKEEIIDYLRNALHHVGPPGTQPNLKGMYMLGVIHSALYLCGEISAEDMPDDGDAIAALVENLISHVEEGTAGWVYW